MRLEVRNPQSEIRNPQFEIPLNPLAACAWGRQPRSPLRRRAALTLAYGPSALYAGIFLAVALSMIDARESLVFFSIAWPALFNVLMLIALTWRDGPAIRLQANWEDYYLAGLSGRQMLWGLAGPRIRSVIALGFTQLGLQVFLVAFIWHAFEAFHGLPIVFFSAVSWGVLAGGVLLDVALWADVTHLWKRFMFIALFILASPCHPLVFFPVSAAIASSLGGLGGGPFIVLAPFAELISWALRGVILNRVWNRTLERLDGPIVTAYDSGHRAW